MKQSHSMHTRVALALMLATIVALGLYFVGVARNQSWDYWYLSYNLALGLVPLLFAFWLVRLLQTRHWKNWLPLLVTFLWLIFLPNSFYIVTDFIHLPEHQRVDIVQDSVMIMQFSLLGLIFGYISLFLLHREFMNRLSKKWAMLLVAVVLFLCSFAIYLGRDLRWNSWDIFLHPLSLAGDVLERLFYPHVHPDGIIMTVSFFAMLASIYFIFWKSYQVLKLSNKN